MEITRSDEETRLDYVEGEQLRLRRIVDEVAHNAKAAREIVSRPRPWSGQDIFRAQVTSAIGPASGSSVGVGTALRAILIGTTLYRVYPHVVITGIVNDMDTQTIPVNALIYYEYIDGQPAVLCWNCGVTSPTAYDDQPH